MTDRWSPLNAAALHMTFFGLSSFLAQDAARSHLLKTLRPKRPAAFQIFPPPLVVSDLTRASLFAFFFAAP